MGAHERWSWRGRVRRRDRSARRIVLALRRASPCVEHRLAPPRCLYIVIACCHERAALLLLQLLRQTDVAQTRRARRRRSAGAVREMRGRMGPRRGAMQRVLRVGRRYWWRARLACIATASSQSTPPRTWRTRRCAALARRAARVRRRRSARPTVRATATWTGGRGETAPFARLRAISRRMPCHGRHGLRRGDAWRRRQVRVGIEAQLHRRVRDRQSTHAVVGRRRRGPRRRHGKRGIGAALPGVAVASHGA